MPSLATIYISSMRVCGDDAIFATHQDEPNIKLIPAMLRRRLSTEAKAAVSFVMDLSGSDRLPILWCSRYGSLARSARMMQSIADQVPMSPTDFSLSVHNAEAGIYSIAHLNKQPVIALSSAHDPLYNYLLEAQLMAQEEQHDVIVVLTDQVIPESLQNIALDSSVSFSVVLRISAQEKGAALPLQTLKGVLFDRLEYLLREVSKSEQL